MSGVAASTARAGARRRPPRRWRGIRAFDALQRVGVLGRDGRRHSSTRTDRADPPASRSGGLQRCRRIPGAPPPPPAGLSTDMAMPTPQLSRDRTAPPVGEDRNERQADRLRGCRPWLVGESSPPTDRRTAPGTIPHLGVVTVTCHPCTQRTCMRSRRQLPIARTACERRRSRSISPVLRASGRYPRWNNPSIWGGRRTPPCPFLLGDVCGPSSRLRGSDIPGADNGRTRSNGGWIMGTGGIHTARPIWRLSQSDSIGWHCGPHCRPRECCSRYGLWR